MFGSAAAIRGSLGFSPPSDSILDRAIGLPGLSAGGAGRAAVSLEAGELVLGRQRGPVDLELR